MALFEQDFIMHQVQYLTQLLQQILFKKEKQQYEEAIEQIQDAFQELTRKNPKKFIDLNPVL